MSEQVDHPNHYSPGPMEVINIIDYYDLDFCLGNVVKYILRAGHKSEDTYLQDLKKARWYLDHKIEKVEEKQ